jgi:hypothetical protein
VKKKFLQKNEAGRKKNCIFASKRRLYFIKKNLMEQKRTTPEFITELQHSVENIVLPEGW